MTDKSIALNSTPGRLDYDNALLMTEDEIRRQLKGTPAVIRRQMSHLARAVGKNIRARVLLASAVCSDGMINSDAVKIAAAIELLHLATLVHDDIIDNAAKRRGIEALNKKFGEKSAVLCGDYLFCLAFQLAATISVQEDRKDSLDNVLPGYLTDICLGELRQSQNNYNYRLSEREYFKTISGKTGALFEASFYSGFLFSDEPDSMKNDYIKIGSSIGIIFQLADDCADYEASQRTTKKPVLSDFRQGVITLPLIFALKADSKLRERISEGIDPRKLKSAVKAAGGLSYTHIIISNYYNESKNLIASLDIAPGKKARLTSLLEKAAGVTAQQTAN